MGEGSGAAERARAERLARALRDNLRRRKAGPPPTPGDASAPEPQRGAVEDGPGPGEGSR